MNPEPNLSLRRSKQVGTWLCLAALVAAGLFVAGVVQGSYWALAIPVAVGVLAVLQLVFWIGYTINVIDRIPEEAAHYRDPVSRRIALAVCAASVGLAVLFLVGLLQGSYLALALPVAAAVLSFLAMIFWIGWAIVTQKTSLPQPASEPASEDVAGEPGGPPS